jgi:predicted SAM-dependent methyltransferase
VWDSLSPGLGQYRLGRPDKHVLNHNLLKGIPFESQTFDVVYHSHFLEHLSMKDARFMVAECHRILKHGGMIRVVVPDLEYNAKLYLKCLEDLARDESAET